MQYNTKQNNTIQYNKIQYKHNFQYYGINHVEFRGYNNNNNTSMI